jgi:hypothetical protein
MDTNIPYIDKIVPIIVSHASPDQIILFGSYARGKNSMKEYTITALIISIMASVLCTACPMSINGDGILVTSEKSLDPFNGISSTVATIHYYENKEYRIVYTIDKNLMDRVSFSYRNGILDIGFSSKGGHTHYPTAFNVDVYSPKLTSIYMGDNSGSANSHLNGQFSSEDTIITSTMDLYTEGKGVIDISIECEDLSAYINNNNGGINITGSGRNANITVNGDGIFDGKKFTANNADVHIIRSGKVWVCVNDFLKAATDDRLARIYYRGNPLIDGSGVHPAQALLKF